MKKFLLRPPKHLPKALSLALASVAMLGSSAQTLQDAIKLTDKEQFEKATGAFKSVLATDPQNGEAWFYMGENYWSNERADSAEFCYSRGVGVAPKFPLNHVGQGKVLWTKGKSAEAQVLFDKAVATTTDKANKFPK